MAQSLPMASLPKTLSMQLNRIAFFHTKEIQKLTPLNKSSFSDGDTCIIRLGSTPTYDLLATSIVAELVFNSTTNAAKTGTLKLGDIISRMELYVGGSLVMGGSLTQDFSTAYDIYRRITLPQYMQAGSSDKLYDEIDIQSIAPSTSRYLHMNDCPLFNWKSMRYLSCSMLPSEIEIRFTFDFSRYNNRDTGVNGTNGAFPKLTYIDNVYMLTPKISIAGPMSIDDLIAARLEQAGRLDVGLTELSMFSGQQYSTSTDFIFSLNRSSIDYIACFNKPTTIIEDLQTSHAGDEVNSTYQLDVSNSPLTSFPLKANDVFYELGEALDGHGGNILVDPRVGQTVADWTTKRFLHLHRFAWPTQGGDEARQLVSGYSSLSNSVPFRWRVNGGNASPKTPYALVISTLVLSILPGRLFTVNP